MVGWIICVIYKTHFVRFRHDPSYVYEYDVVHAETKRRVASSPVPVFVRPVHHTAFANKIALESESRTRWLRTPLFSGLNYAHYARNTIVCFNVYDKLQQYEYVSIRTSKR